MIILLLCFLYADTGTRLTKYILYHFGSSNTVVQNVIETLFKTAQLPGPYAILHSSQDYRTHFIQLLIHSMKEPFSTKLYITLMQHF